MNGPTRIRIQREYSGPAPTIGAAPASSPAPTTARYQDTLAAKQAMDRYTVSQMPQRPRSAGPVAPRSSSPRSGAIVGGAGGGAGNGAGNGALATASAGAWWQNPYIWGAAIAIYLFTMKARK